MVLIGNNTKSHNQGKESESEPQTNVATTLLRKGKKRGMTENRCVIRQRYNERRTKLWWTVATVTIAVR